MDLEKLFEGGSMFLRHRIRKFKNCEIKCFSGTATGRDEFQHIENIRIWLSYNMSDDKDCKKYILITKNNFIDGLANEGNMISINGDIVYFPYWRETAEEIDPLVKGSN